MSGFSLSGQYKGPDGVWHAAQLEARRGTRAHYRIYKIKKLIKISFLLFFVATLAALESPDASFLIYVAIRKS